MVRKKTKRTRTGIGLKSTKHAKERIDRRLVELKGQSLEFLVVAIKDSIRALRHIVPDTKSTSVSDLNETFLELWTQVQLLEGIVKQTQSLLCEEYPAGSVPDIEGKLAKALENFDAEFFEALSVKLALEQVSNKSKLCVQISPQFDLYVEGVLKVADYNVPRRGLWLDEKGHLGLMRAQLSPLSKATTISVLYFDVEELKGLRGELERRRHSYKESVKKSRKTLHELESLFTGEDRLDIAIEWLIHPKNGNNRIGIFGLLLETAGVLKTISVAKDVLDAKGGCEIEGLSGQDSKDQLASIRGIELVADLTTALYAFLGTLELGIIDNELLTGKATNCLLVKLASAWTEERFIDADNALQKLVKRLSLIVRDMESNLVVNENDRIRYVGPVGKKWGFYVGDELLTLSTAKAKIFVSLIESFVQSQQLPKDEYSTRSKLFKELAANRQLPSNFVKKNADNEWTFGFPPLTVDQSTIKHCRKELFK